MSKAKIALYLALIFIAGAVAGGAIAVKSSWGVQPPRRMIKHGSPEDFANHLFTQLKERLSLTPEQVVQVEPVFRAGFAEVRSIQEKSLGEVEEAIRRNHEEIARLLTEEQRAKLAVMERERNEFLMKRGGRRPPSSPPQD